jgi:hypothetical protein
MLSISVLNLTQKSPKEKEVIPVGMNHSIELVAYRQKDDRRLEAGRER